jgi:alpha-methylacyl-CoA racemase
MLFSDLGADVVRVDRASDVRRPDPQPGVLGRGRRSIGIDLKEEAGVSTLMRLVERADALFEGFRPGVMERLGCGPDACFERNPRLVYGRMTGWGQTGPWSNMAGHDINYISLSGALGAIGRADEAPVPPLNLVGDFGGGGMLLAFGILAALHEARESGRGQVVDASMVEGSALLTTTIYELIGIGTWNRKRGTNIIDGGAPYYDVYRTSDGEYVSLGSIEPQFFTELVERLELDVDASSQSEKRDWPALRAKIAKAVENRTRAEWGERLAGSDVCFAPVLHPTEAPQHPHNVARESFVEVGGITQPAPAPRFSRTPVATPQPAPVAGAHTQEVLRDWGFGDPEIEELSEQGAIARAGEAQQPGGHV